MRRARIQARPARCWRSLWPVLVAVVFAGAIAACGTSHKSQAGAVSSATAQGIRFAECMRSHGVPKFPDPGGSGDAAQIPQGSSPALEAAQRTCQTLMPVAGGASQATAQTKATMLGLSQCMRAHAVTDFPGPIHSLPANPRFSSVFGPAGALIGIPITIDTRSPAFRRAATACRLPGS